jgi:hypothetical protein
VGGVAGNDVEVAYDGGSKAISDEGIVKIL